MTLREFPPTQASTTNSDSLDLSLCTKKEITVYLIKTSKDVSIELVSYKSRKEKAQVNFSGKLKKSTIGSKYSPGLYEVIIENKSINGLSEDWKLLKYDNGVSVEKNSEK